MYVYHVLSTGDLHGSGRPASCPRPSRRPATSRSDTSKSMIYIYIYIYIHIYVDTTTTTTTTTTARDLQIWNSNVLQTFSKSCL